jgi:hypothetical protein
MEGPVPAGRKHGADLAETKGTPYGAAYRTPHMPDRGPGIKSRPLLASFRSSLLSRPSSWGRCARVCMCTHT